MLSPGFHHLKRILRKSFHILSLDPSNQDLLTKPPLSSPENPPNSVNSLLSFHPYRPATPQTPDPAPDVRLVPFTSSCTNLTYPITTHADCKSMNLIYQLGETHHSLSDRMNGHHFTTTVSNPDLPVDIHTQSH